MPIVSLTDLTIRHLQPMAGGQVTYYDRTIKGFGVRVTEHGKMSYILLLGANRRRIKLGDVGVLKLADARTKAKMLLAEKQLGVHQQVDTPTYEAALTAFLEVAAERNKPRTVRDYTRLLTRGGFGREKLRDITPKDIQRKLDKLKATPSEQAHIHAALQIFFRFCVRRQLMDKSPMERVEKPSRQVSRSRVLSEAELKAVWQASDGVFGAIVKLCILLGQRRSEIAQLRWSWIEGDLLTLPASITKNKREHRVPIGPMALAILAEQPHIAGQDYVFPARKTWRAKSTVYNAWGKDKPKLDARARVTGWVLHDLRRTMVSSWAALGMRLELIEKYINHVSGSFGGIVGVYQRHNYLPEMRAAVLAWEAKLQSVLNFGTV